MVRQAVALQLEVNDAQVDSAVEDIKRRNNFDDAQLDLALAGQGLDRKAFKAQVRRELESMQVLNFKVRSRVKVSEEDLQNYYKTHPAAFGGAEELHVRHLFLPLAEGNIDNRIAVDALADMVALGRRSFERRFKQATNNSVLEYIQRVKIESAKRSFENSRKNINEVMYNVGYTDTKAFRTG